MNEPYGTTEYYKTHFMDILSDAASEDTVDENMPHVERILEGFQNAVTEWLNYHQNAADTYRIMLDKYLMDDDNGRFSDPSSFAEEEEDALPPIPDIPSVLK